MGGAQGGVSPTLLEHIWIPHWQGEEEKIGGVKCVRTQ